MKLRTAAFAGFAALLAASAGAEPPAPAIKAQTSTPSARTAAQPVNAQPLNAQPLNAMFSKFTGEWEGQQSFTNWSGDSSASFISMSNRIEQNNTVFSTTVDGMAFGKVFEAAGRYTGSGSAWYDSVANSTVRFSSPTEGSNSLTFSGQFTDTSGKTWKVEQVWTLKDANSFTAEFFRTGDNNTRESFATFDMTRMAKGQRSSAFGNFSNAKLWSNLKPAASTQASVNESR